MIQVTCLWFVVIQAVKRMHDVDSSALNFFLPTSGLIAAVTPRTTGYGCQNRLTGYGQVVPLSSQRVEVWSVYRLKIVEASRGVG